MASNLSALPLIEPKSPAEWRRWLTKNHASSSGVWVAIGKKSAPEPKLAYEDEVLEALAFGWIDSTVYKLDEYRVRQLWTPRKRGSGWAASNKARVERLLAEGRMQPAGLAAVESAKADGSWNLFDDIEALVIPKDLQDAFDAEPEAEAAFGSLTESIRKQLLYRLALAKRPETRAKRIAETIAAAQGGRLPW